MKFSFFSKIFSRDKIVISVFLLFASALILKLFLVQIVRSESYEQKADHQYATPASDIFERGTIFFQNKDGELVSAATQASGYKLAINPSKLEEAKEAYEKLSEIISLDEESFMEKAGKEGDPYEEITGHLSREQADEISALNISGVSVYKEKWRFYPGSELASHALGFVGYKGNDLGGRYGLERHYESVLSRSKDEPYVNFFAEVFSNLSETIFKGEEARGDVITSIEPTVQGFLEKTLSFVKARYSSRSAGGIIMDPKDGSIYAIAALPSFDPNNFAKESSNDIFSNPLVENVLEFGSVVKPLIMAAALDTGVLTTETTYDDKGSVMVEQKEIFNFDKKGRGVVDMQEVLSQSLNTGMVFVSRKLGKENMREYLLSFGIDDKTGIDLPNETSGLVSNLKSPREIEYANASFGQGIAMTPIEMVRALASLSNGGNLVVPHLAQKIRYEGGLEKELTYLSVPTKIRPETSEEITRMLVGVMDSLRGGTEKLDRYSIAVKTGTAQVADTENGGYYEDRYTHSFFGYLPAYNPRFIIFLYATDPRGVRYSSETWSGPFLDTAKFLINYYEIPPDR